MYNNIINKIQNVDYGYYRRDEGKDPVFLTKKEIDLINENLDKILESGSNINWSFRYQLSYIILDTFYNDPSYFKKLSSEDKLGEDLTELLYREGIFFGEKCHYSIATNPNMSSETRVTASKCITNIDMLKKLIKSKDAKVRAEAYRSLGIEDNLDAISKDRSKEVRVLGINYLPFGSPHLKKFLEKEKASENLIKLAKKMKKEDLLFVINKKSRSKWGDKEFKRILKMRIM